MTALMNNSLGGYDVCIGVCVCECDEVESQRREENDWMFKSLSHTSSFGIIYCHGYTVFRNQSAQLKIGHGLFKCLFSTGYKKKGVALLKVRPSFCRSVARLT